MAELAGAIYLAAPSGGTSLAALVGEKTAWKAAKKILTDEVVRKALSKELKQYGIKKLKTGAIVLGSQEAIHLPEETMVKMVGTPTFSNDTGSVNISV
jgi:hypothetical protein